MRDLRIVFMGTPDFAVPCLDILVKHGYNVVGVITSTDKYGGRGNKKLLQSAVKKYALEKNLNILQPKNLKGKRFNKELKALNANLQIVVAFRMLPEMVWNMPEYGTFNLHGSLLPSYRGAAPINWAVINNEETTGVTSFKLKHEIDTGDTALHAKIPVFYFDSVKEVHDRMQYVAAETILKTVRGIEKNETSFTPQDQSLVSHAPKLFPDTCQIDVNTSVSQLYHFIRGLNPFPSAWTTLEGLKLKIFEAEPVEEVVGDPGSFLTDNKSYLRLCCSNGYLDILQLQLQGKKRMPVKDFLNGYSLSLLES
jgi:methionyl-tRNA formyltransferase